MSNAKSQGMNKETSGKTEHGRTKQHKEISAGCMPGSSRQIAATRWCAKQYMNMKRLQEQQVELLATGQPDKKSPPPRG
jgi:hypothetical protein